MKSNLELLKEKLLKHKNIKAEDEYKQQGKPQVSHQQLQVRNNQVIKPEQVQKVQVMESEAINIQEKKEQKLEISHSDVLKNKLKMLLLLKASQPKIDDTIKESSAKNKQSEKARQNINSAQQEQESEQSQSNKEIENIGRQNIDNKNSQNNLGQRDGENEQNEEMQAQKQLLIEDDYVGLKNLSMEIIKKQLIESKLQKSLLKDKEQLQKMKDPSPSQQQLDEQSIIEAEQENEDQQIMEDIEENNNIEQMIQLQQQRKDVLQAQPDNQGSHEQVNNAAEEQIVNQQKSKDLIEQQQGNVNGDDQMHNQRQIIIQRQADLINISQPHQDIQPILVQQPIKPAVVVMSALEMMKLKLLQSRKANIVVENKESVILTQKPQQKEDRSDEHHKHMENNEGQQRQQRQQDEYCMQAKDDQQENPCQIEENRFDQSEQQKKEMAQSKPVKKAKKIFFKECQRLSLINAKIKYLLVTKLNQKIIYNSIIKPDLRNLFQSIKLKLPPSSQ